MSPFPRLPRWREGEPVPNCIGCQLGRKVPLEKCPPLTDDTALVCPACDRRCAAVAAGLHAAERAAVEARDRATAAPFLDRGRVKHRQSGALLDVLFADGRARSAASLARVTGLGQDAVYQMLHRANDRIEKVEGGYRARTETCVP